MPSDSLYKTDFYTWAQQQAELLAQSDDPRIDVENLAEEVAALGRSALRATDVSLLRALIGLIKLASSSGPHPKGHWQSDVREQLCQAQDAYAPGMRPLIDLDELWRKALKLANYELSDYGEPGAPRDLPCPFTLDDLLDPEFEPAHARARLEHALAAHRS